MEMHIDLLDGYWIGADRLNYILKRTYIAKEGTRGGKQTGGKMVTKELGYYRSIPQLLEKFLKVYAKERTADYNGDLEGYAKLLKEEEGRTVKRLATLWNVSDASKEIK